MAWFEQLVQHFHLSCFQSEYCIEYGFPLRDLIDDFDLHSAQVGCFELSRCCPLRVMVEMLVGSLEEMSPQVDFVEGLVV